MSSSSSPSASPGRSLAEFFHREPGILLTLGYVLLSAVGMTYRYFLLAAFGVNVFDLYDVNDFLLAGLRDPILVAFMLASYLVLWLGLAYEKRVADRRKGKGRPAWLMSLAYALCVTLWFAVFTIVYAQKSAQDIADGRGQRVEVTESGTTTQYMLIAITGRFTVVYDPPTRQAEAISNEQIQRIAFLNPASKAPSPPPALSGAG